MPLRHSLLGLTLALCLVGCEGKVVTAPGDSLALTEESAQVMQEDYKIGAGDEIELKFYFTPEMNDKFTVRPDGYITVMFAGDIKAAGRTTRQLSKQLRKKLTKHIKQLEFAINVRSFNSQRAYVGGEVAKPGAIALAGHPTLLQVLDEAGWVTPAGRMNEIVLIRRNPNGDEEVYPLNISKIMSGEDVSQNVVVKAGDTILVPPLEAVDVDRWVDRNIRLVTPLPVGAVINRGVGPR